jgi:predicted dinucleotide-binding enzyme
LVADLTSKEANDGDLANSGVVFVVVPAKAIPEAVTMLSGHKGVVVSVSVSGSGGRDRLPSCTEQLAAALPDAKIINAFSSV